MEWISVHDEKPKDNTNVLCYVYNDGLKKEYVVISNYHELCNCRGRFAWSCERSIYPEDVMFWQSLPEPPTL